MKISMSPLRKWVGVGMVGLFALTAGVAQAASAAADDAGNYTALTFTNGSNLGTGFGAWDLWNVSATLGDSTGGGGGDLNSTNGYSFRFMTTGSNDWCNGRRNFGSALAEGDKMSYTFTYNWDGGGRGVDIFCSTGQFANLIDVSAGNTFKVNGSTLSTNWSPGAVVAVEVTQLTNGVNVFLTRAVAGVTNLVYSTNVVNDLPATGMGFYNGGYSCLPVDTVNYAIFVNNLVITPNPALTLSISGHDAMAAGMTNLITLTRGGSPLDAVTFTLASSASGVAGVPASVDFNAGSTSTSFPVEAYAFGPALITVTNAAYPGASLQTMVFDLGYDDSSYAGEGNAFTNSGNSGLGFQPWLFISNHDGQTNFAGGFLGSSLDGGADVNVNGNSFGLFANGSNAPSINVIRQFNSTLAIGQAVSVNLGVVFRNGSKGVKFQNSGNAIFEVAAYNDNYWYKIGNNAAVNLNWAYASDSKIGVDVKRVQDHLYDVTLTREGSGITNLALGVIDLGYTAPNEVLFFNFNTDSSAGGNNLYFNRLALYTGYQLALLGMVGNDGMVINKTNVFTVTRSGPTTNALTVNLVSDAPALVGVPASVEIAMGQTSATFAVSGLSNGFAGITAEATGAVGTSYDVTVFDLAYDDTTYYPPALFAHGDNGGVGFGPWVVALNDGPGIGFTNYVGAALGSSAVANGDVDSRAGNAFSLYANGDGTGGDAPQATAIRSFAALAVGESITVDLGINYRNGSKGVIFQNGNDWLFEFAAFSDAYHYNVRDLGADSPVALGWSYASDSAINVTLSRVDATTYNVQFTRSGGAVTQTLVQAITLSLAPDRMRFYVNDTDAGGDENNLYVNRLAQFTGYVGEISTATDGIPNTWWDRYGIIGGARVATNNPDGDGDDNWNEYVADTDPTMVASVFPNLVDAAAGAGVITLQTGPTTNSRVYDVWFSTNLMGAPQTWTRYGLNVPGVNGTNVVLQVTNDVPTRVYRSGVALP